MRLLNFALILSVLCVSSCSTGLNEKSRSETAPVEKAAADAPGGQTAQKQGNTIENSGSAQNLFVDEEKNKSGCARIDTGEKTVLKSQTFPIDFAPFKNSCFVTAHDPEYTDPPLGSEFSIYRDGEEVFFFPGQFNGVTIGCWVEAVSFQDLNTDNLTDIIVVGKCSAKTAPYHENMVYVNTGRTFITDEDANYKLVDLKTIKDIADFVKRNKQIFF